ncbi:polyprenyl synthetase family protein [Desulfurispirillum indicum]|uniref:Polyprenyl synthetase n=1 Tax=Desulfurispirillum indicum (strain ATCC BAA-1389 / DSM 22839 / S5) TaxID=653733 RepID=E6W1C9_DESIS|nr:polyprenyl synthetase family protein [Desulfurispirillum indicum]ADU65385.1 Polyprenyl synthetase [Desulfurispirillum indicum S5]UCZ57278.1 polyprenyl synthetase family protein [Desulfurispirillum indicum]
MNIADVYALLKPQVAEIEQEIQSNLTSRVRRVQEVGEYIFQSGGKRIRPLLVLLTSKLCGGDERRAIKIGGIIEYIHTATLLHDDVIDEACVRRGRDSANFKFGNEMVILVGDYLYSKAFQVLVADGDPRVQKTLSDVTTLMSEGEVFQLVKSFDFSVTLEDYFQIIEHKTAILIAACAKCGGYTAPDLSEEMADALWDFGYNIGMAFQLIDDILDYMGDASTLGKTIGTDLKEGKMTIPVIKLRDLASEEEKDRLEKLIEQQMIPTAEDLSFVIGLMDTYDIRRHSMDVAYSFLDKARKAAEVLPAGIYRDCLHVVADYVINRQL